MKERVNLSEWRSERGRHRFRALEQELWDELWPDPPVAVDVETHLGPTRVYRWDGSGDPVLFLHGTTGTSLAWTPYIAEIGGRTAYAVDTIGDVGRSEQRVAVDDFGDLASWLDETLDSVGLDRAHVVGTSYGGHLGLQLALHHPARVRSLTLIDPAGLARLQFGRFMVWGTASMFASLLPGPLRRAAAHRLRMPLLEDARILRMAFAGQRAFRPRLLRPGTLPDEELARIDAPVLLVVGGKSEVFDPREGVTRAEANFSDLEVVVVPDAGHAVMMSDIDTIAPRMRELLDRAGVA